MKAISLLVLFSIIMAFAGLAWAANADILVPVVATVADGGSINLGKIGPGQTIDIVVNGVVPLPKGSEGRWQILRVVDVPQGWEGFDSKELGVKMQAGVKAADDAKDGEYRITFRLDEDSKHQQGLGSVTFQVIVTVSKNVLAVSLPKQSIETGVGQPARYSIVLKSTSVASDVFEIYAEDVPVWSYKKAVHVPAGTTVNTFYEIVANEEKEYNPTIIIRSQSSGVINSSQKVTMVVKTDVIGDIKATRNGVLIFPMVLEPLYSLLGIIGSFM